MAANPESFAIIGVHSRLPRSFTKIPSSGLGRFSSRMIVMVFAAGEPKELFLPGILSSMCLEPVGAEAAFDDDGHAVERQGIGHEAFDERADRFFFVEGHFEDEFVVDLEEQA